MKSRLLIPIARPSPQVRPSEMRSLKRTQREMSKMPKKIQKEIKRILPKSL